MGQNVFLCIDLKSFYASVECVERGLNPMTTNLVVADASRTQKTICLAVSPALKRYGISGRARLFEVMEKVRQVNAQRRLYAPKGVFSGKSHFAYELDENPALELDYIIAPPRMAHYIMHSTKIYEIYLKYIAPEDIHVYSIDEVFMDITHYLKTYDLTPRELASKMIREVYKETGITATAGIGTNMYLAKVAMDIEAKHIQEDEDGVRIAELDEISYRKKLWNHRPLTDFWRVGKGYAKKLEERGLYTMGDIARCSIGDSNSYYNEDMLYKLFGVNAELLIDHAWGWEPCTMADVKSYRPENNSIGSGQVLHSPYEVSTARIVLREMAEALAIQLVEHGLATNQIVLTVGYDIENLNEDRGTEKYQGEVKIDHYGRRIPKHAHGTENFAEYTSSVKQITDKMLELYDRLVDSKLMVRRLNMSANRVILEKDIVKNQGMEQMSLFVDYEAEEAKAKEQEQILAKEKQMVQAVIDIKKKFGKNAILKGSSLMEGATAKERNNQIGGHKA